MSVTFAHERLRDIAHRIVQAGGSSEAEAAVVAGHLVDANLAGHDSHGVGVLPHYVRDIQAGLLRPNQAPEIVLENGSFAVWDGRLGYGQRIQHEAMEWCIATAKRLGVAVHALRDSHHIGRVGAYGEQAAAAGVVSVQFVRSDSGETFVAPFRGREGRYMTNPVCIAIPATATNPAFLLDFATSKLAMGKVREAHQKGVELPEGAVVAANGSPTRDPGVMYREPPGALLPFGEHKGYGLALACEILAGAMTGHGTTKGLPPYRGALNGSLSIVLDPSWLGAQSTMATEIDAFIAWVKSTPPADPSLPVLVAGEPERLNRAERLSRGIVIADMTWKQICEAASTLDVRVET
jgi:uncharacterized oxidoreductase